jgi:NADPH:quinone reductase-like Zn-dependent oxidoreductase
MKAVVHREYGSPDVLAVEELAKPSIGGDGVLVRVRAAAANPIDCRLMRGKPAFLRAMSGLSRPKDGRLGFDLAGEVESVGERVTRFGPGDEVFGCSRGAFAEYVAAKEDALAPKPAGFSHEQAAALGVAALTALQALRDRGKLQSGQEVLINGASGGVGTFAVQIAKALGARVTGVCSTVNLDFVRGLGADEVIDYTREDFTRRSGRYDLLLDTAASRSPSDCKRVLRPGGVGVLVGAPHGSWPALAYVLAAVAASLRRPKVALFLARSDAEDLRVLKELGEAGKVVPVIDRTYPLGAAAEALRYLEQGHARGKVILTL